MSDMEFRRPANLPYLECRYAHDSKARYGAHSHLTVSLGIVESGESIVTVEQDAFHVQAGQVVLFDAGQVHACNPAPDQIWSYHMLYFDKSWWVAIMRELTGGDCANVTTAHPDCEPQLVQDLIEINKALITAPDERMAELELNLISLLNRLASCLQSQNAPLHRQPSPPAWFDEVRDILETRYREPVTLEDLCRRAKVTKGPLIRQFKRHAGLTPYAFLQNVRITHARERLAEGAVIADVAQELGFSDQSHLNRLFKRLVASTPGHYRNDLARA